MLRLSARDAGAFIGGVAALPTAPEVAPAAGEEAI